MTTEDTGTPEVEVASTEVEGEVEGVEGEVEQENSEPVELSIEEQITALLKKSGGMKRKVNGKERNFQSFEDMFKTVSMDLTANERLSQASKLQKEAEAQMEAYKSGDLPSFLKKKYGDLTAKEARKALEETVQLLLDEEGVSPDEKELRRYRKMEADIKQREAEEKANKEKSAYDNEVKSMADKLVADVTASAKKLGLPEDSSAYELVFKELQIAAENDIDLSTDEAVRLVRDRSIGTSLDFLKALKVEEIESILGDDLVKQIRGRGVAAVKSAASAFDKPAAKKDSKQPSSNDKSVAVKEIDLTGRGRYAHLISR